MNGELFWSKVQKSDACWLWLGAKNERGYGSVGFRRRSRGAHRVAWEITNGPIPAGLCVCHHCDNPSCVRPDHLFLGTASDNLRDASLKGRMHRQSETCCAKGHPYPSNGRYRQGFNGRVCKVCQQIRRGVTPKSDTHCKRGHLRTPENTYRYESTGRIKCLLCGHMTREGREARLQATHGQGERRCSCGRFVRACNWTRHVESCRRLAAALGEEPKP